MKKRFIIISGILVTILLSIYFFIPFKITQMITHYEPFTFEKILEYDSMRSNYGIGQHNSPMDYGFKDAKEISINSLYDHKRLSSWYVPSSNSTKCIVVEFDSVDHVKIYQDPRYKAKYTDLVSEFIRN